MSPLSVLAAAEPAATQPSIGTPMLWAVTIGAIVVLLVVDFLITRRPHAVSMKEAIGWSAFYVAIPVGFGVWIWQQYGGDRGLEYYTGYLVEKSLSVDNLFVFLLLLTAFAVPRELQQRVLLIGVAGALVLRGIFIALGAQLIASFSWAFLLFGAVLLVTAVKVGRDALSPDDHTVDIGSIRTVRVLRRLWPVTESYDGTRMTVRQAGRRALTPLALVTVAILGTDVVFAIDSVPAVYGITGDPYLVFATNAFALLGLRALYFVVEGALGSLRHLGHGLAAILAFIGVKLVLRGVFIALGAQLISSFSWAFLLFGAVLLVTAVKVGRDALSDKEHTVDIGSLRTVRLLSRLWPVTESYDGTRMTVRQAGRRALTPLALVTVAILGTDVVFAIDSVPAVYGITGDAYLVFATNAFALLGLRALYFVVEGALGSLRHLGHGLATILAFIGVKLVLHWAHGVWPAVPEVPTLASLAVIVGILALATTTSVLANRRDARRATASDANSDADVAAEVEPEPERESAST